MPANQRGKQHGHLTRRGHVRQGCLLHGIQHQHIGHRADHSHQQSKAPLRQRVHKGIAYGLLTGAFIASYTVVDGYAVKVLLMSPILIDYMGNFVRVALLVPVVLRDLPTARTLWLAQWRFALLVAVVSPVAYVLVLYAMQQAPLSHVAPAREVSMLFAALIGGHLLGEGDRVARILGAVCIAAGVTALALG